MNHNIKKLIVILFLANLAQSLIVLFAPIYLAEAGFTAAEIGLAVGAVFFAAIVTTFLLGVSNDRTTPRKLIVAALLLDGAFYLLLPNLAGFAMLIGAFLLFGFASNMLEITGDCLTYKSVDRRDKGFQIGAVSFSRTMGSALTFLIGGVIIAAIGFVNVFYALALLPLLLIPLALKLGMPKLCKSGYAFYLKDIGKKEIALFALVMVLLSFHVGAERTVMPLYASETLGLSTAPIGLMFFISEAVYGGFLLFGGVLADRFRHHRLIFICGLALSALGNIAYGFSPGFWEATLSRVVHEAGDGVAHVFYGYSITEFFGKGRVGGNYGIMMTFILLAKMVGSIVSGAISPAVGYGGAMAFAGALTLVGVALLALPTKSGKRIFKRA